MLHPRGALYSLFIELTIFTPCRIIVHFSWENSSKSILPPSAIVTWIEFICSRGLQMVGMIWQLRAASSAKKGWLRRTAVEPYNLVETHSVETLRQLKWLYELANKSHLIKVSSWMIHIFYFQNIPESNYRACGATREMSALIWFDTLWHSKHNFVQRQPKYINSKAA